MQMYDMNGVNCGHLGDEQPVPYGYWVRGDDSLPEMSSLEFLEKIGPDRFAGVWMASQQMPQIAYALMRGLAAQAIYLHESFPSLLMLEGAGILQPGTAFEVWA